MSNKANTRFAVVNPEDVLTVGDLINLLGKLDPTMWACATVEGHSYPLTICNAGVLETSKIHDCAEDFHNINMFFLDINKNSFMNFLEAEIINPMKRATLQ